MGVDWDRLVGQGGAYFVERAAAAQRMGRLPPAALRLVEDEAQRLKFILDEEITRFEPAGALTPAAIATLRMLYQARLDAAESVIAAARGREESAPTLPAAPTLPSPEGARGYVAAPAGGEGKVSTPASREWEDESEVEEEAPQRGKSWREFFADRSILVLSYIGAFLLIVATLLFELSAFTAVGSTARFAGVLVLNLVFGVAGWICFRMRVMRLVGRSYITIAALMLPLTLIAAWVYLGLQQYGLSRDLAIAIAAASCALLYGILAVSLESKGYAALSLIGIAVAWGATVDLVDPGRWRGAWLIVAAAVYLVIAYRSARLSRFHAVYSRFADWAIHLAAFGALAATAVSTINLPGREAWPVATITAALLALLYIVYALMARSPAGGAAAMVFFGVAWISALNIVDLEPLTGLLITPLIAVYTLVAFAGARLGALGAAYARFADRLVHAVALIAIGWSAVPALSDIGQGHDISQPSFWHLAWSLGALTAAYALYSWLSGQRFAQWTVAVGVTLTTITANQALGLSQDALAIEFLVLAIAHAIVARVYRGTRTQTFFYVTAAIQAVIAAAIPVEQDVLRTVILMTGSAVAAFMAIDGDRPEWLYLAGGFFTYGWYWVTKVSVPPPPNAGPSTLEFIFSPLPVIYAATAIAMHRFGTSRRWRLPLYVWAGAVALGVAYLAVGQGEKTIFGFALLAYAAAIYIAAALEVIPAGVPAASLIAAVGVLSLLMVAPAAPRWYPLTFGVFAWLIYIVTFVWTGPERQTWRRIHRYTGLALMTLTAAACLRFSDVANTSNQEAFVALDAMWALAFMLGIEARVGATPIFDYAALIAASLGSYWIALAFGGTNPQWYVAAPGLALIAGGIVLHSDRRFKTPLPTVANAMIALGATALLGLTAIQTTDPALSTSLYIGLLLVEGIAALLAGIATRSRALVLAGAAGTALASLRALVILIQGVPLFIVFGLVAAVLLGGAAALAVLRSRLGDARIAMTRSWNDWS